MIFFDQSILTIMYACLYFKEFHPILRNLCEVKASCKTRLDIMMTPFGPNRTMDASIANLFLFAYDMQKRI
jgi:hypothetical protein